METINDIERLSRIFKVLGDANRLSIVLSIGRESLSVTEIIHETGLSQTLVSFHLRTLRKARIVKTQRDGPFIYYSLSAPGLMDVLNDLSHINTGNNKGKDTFETISVKGLEKQKR